MIKKRDHKFIYLVVIILVVLVVLSIVGVFVGDLAGEAYRKQANMIVQTKITKQAKATPFQKITEVIKPIYRSSEGRIIEPEKRTFEKVETVIDPFPKYVGEIKGSYIKYKDGVDSLKCDKNNEGKIVNVVYGDKPTDQFSAFCYQMFGNYFWTECDAGGSKVEHQGDGVVLNAGQYGEYVCALDNSGKKEYWYYCGDNNPEKYGYQGVAIPNLETNPLDINGNDYYCIDGGWITYHAKIFLPNPILNPEKTTVILKNLINPPKLKGKNVEIKFVCGGGNNLCYPNIDVNDLLYGELQHTHYSDFSVSPSLISMFDLVSAYYYADTGIELLKKLGFNNDNKVFTLTIIDLQPGGINLNLWDQLKYHDPPLTLWSKEDELNGLWDISPTFHEVVHAVHYYLKGGQQFQEKQAENFGENEFDGYAEVIQESYAKYFEGVIIDSPMTQTYFTGSIPPDFSFDNNYDLNEIENIIGCVNTDTHLCTGGLQSMTLVSALWNVRESLGNVVYNSNSIKKADRIIFESMKYRFHDSEDHFDYGPLGGTHFHCDNAMKTMLEMVLNADSVFYGGEDEDAIIDAFGEHGISRDNSCKVIETQLFD